MSQERLALLCEHLPAHRLTPQRVQVMRSALLVEADRVPQRKSFAVPTRALAMVALAATFALGVFVTRPEPAVDRLAERQAEVTNVAAADFQHTRTRVAEVYDEVVRLERGRIRVAVHLLQRDERFRVVAGDGEVEVRGTAFTVDVKDDHLAEVVVESGVVVVRPFGQPEVVLRKGDRWPLSPEPAAEPAPEPEPASPPARRLPTPQKVVPEPVPETDAIDRGSPAPAVDELPPAPNPAPWDAPTPASEPVPAPQKPSVPQHQQLFDRGFQALSRGNADEAAALLKESLAADPSGVLAPDARFFRGVALARAGQKKQAQAVLVDFIARHKESPRAGEAAAMLGWLRLDSGDLAGAEAAFQEAAADPVAADSASRGLAEVRKRLQASDK